MEINSLWNVDKGKGIMKRSEDFTGSGEKLKSGSMKFIISRQNEKQLHDKSLYLSLVRFGVLGCIIGMLAACANNAPRQQQIPIAQEVAHYKANARSYYTPPGPPEDPWGPYIREASARFDVPEIWIRAVMQQESGGSLYHNGQLVTSGPGAMGLMQLMPPTYDEMKIAYNLGDDAYDPHDNIMAGTAYIRQMYDIYGSPGFLAAYNGGPGRLDDFLTHNRTLPLETRRYVASIGPQIQGIKPNRQSQADLMVEGHENGMGVSAVQYAAATQAGFQRMALSPQAQAVQNAWQNRQTTETLNQASLNGTSSATTDSLNRQSLQGAGSAATQVAMASPLPSQPAVSTYPVKWKNFDTHPVASSTAPSVVTRQDVKSAWLARGYQSTQAPAMQSRPMPVQVASAPAALPSRSERKQYYRPISYQFPAAVATVNYNRKRGMDLTKKENESSLSGNWGIQVGAFASSSQAKNAIGIAKNRASLFSGKQQVQVVQKGKSKIYRARVTGLSLNAAQMACKKLTACIMVKPSNS